MVKLRTHFEQVPLEVVKKIVEEKAKQEQTAEQSRVIKPRKLQEKLSQAVPVHG